MFLNASTLPSTTDAVFATGNPDGAGKRGRWVATFGALALMVFGDWVGATAQTKATTSTDLAVTSGGSGVTTVISGSVVTLTATVNAGTPVVTTGQVNFCDASATFCTDIHLLGTAQLTSAGKATFKLRPGIGNHSYKAVFSGTNSNAASSSSVSALTVTGKYPTATSIAQSGSPGNYTLTATVTGSVNRSDLVAPTGTVSFPDSSYGNSTLGTSALGTGSAGLSFVNSSNPATVMEPNVVATADFNGDGIPDLAVSNSNSGQVLLTILLGNGDGTFRATATSPTVGLYPDSIVVADFNSDGIPDLALTSVDQNLVTVLLGVGDGTFTVLPNLNTGSVPQSVTTGDFNGDGIADLAVVNAGSVLIFQGNGDGTFTKVPTTLPTGMSPIAVAVGDFNGDGIADLTVVNNCGNSYPCNNSNGTIMIFLGKGDGTFTQVATTPTVGPGPAGLVVADFNGDGFLDLAVADYGGGISGGAVTILLGNGDGTFKAPTYYGAPGLNFRSLSVGDFNGDGISDLAVVGFWHGTLDYFLGKGDGTFAAAVAISVNLPLGSGYMASADFNADGIPDLAMPNQDVSGTVVILLVEPTISATATISGVSPVGPSPHLVDASYFGDSTYNPSISETTSLVPQVATPVFSPGAGVYSSISSITITDATPGSTIYYFATGSLSTGGYVPYTGPIPVYSNGGATIQAYATETGFQQSATANASYTFSLPSVPAPLFSLGSGYYATAQTVTISDSVSGANIFYTTNGQTPTQSSTPYTGPIAVSSSETLTAIAMVAGYNSSPATTAQYVIGSSSSSFIYTLAGTGTFGYTGDGGAATLAELASPFAVIEDAAGNTYIADESNHVVRKVAAGTGIISTVAGNGNMGNSGDGGLATNATLSYPVALALDGLGSLFIADAGGTVRQVNLTTGIISTYAGNPSGTSYVSGSVATAVSIPGIYGIAIDASRNLYLSSLGSILKVTDSTRVITTLAGTNMSSGYGGDNGPADSAALNVPRGLAFDASGNLYVADENNYVVRKITATGGVITSNSIITTVAGIPKRSGFGGVDGPATSTLLAQPASVAVDNANNVYIGDVGAQIIWQLNASTGNLTRLAGTGTGSCTSYGEDGGPATSSAVCYPYGLFVDATHNLFIADNVFDRVREIYSAALPPSAQAVAPTFSLASGTYPTLQTVTISDSTPGASIYVSIDGSTPTTVSNGYSFPINIAGAITIKAVATAPGYLTSTPVSASYSVTAFEPIISTIAGNGTSGFAAILGLPGLGAGGPAANVVFAHTQGVALDKTGNIFVSDYSNHIVWKFAAGTRTATIFAGTGAPGPVSSGVLATNARLYYPMDLVVDSVGNLYIADTGNSVVRKVNAATGIITTVAGSGVAYGINPGDGGPATSAPLYPNALAMDGADNLYIADRAHYEIRKVSALTGIITDVAGNGTSTFSGDGGLATNAGLELANALAVTASGDVYFSSASARIRKVTASTGIISTVAGYFGSAGETGDGGPATSAQLNVNGLALDSGGNLYITNGPGTIRMLNTTTGVISRVAGIGFPGFSGDSGPAITARLGAPNGLAFDPAGDLVVSDPANYRVRKISFASQTVATPVISLPSGTYINSQSVTITDTPGSTIYYTIDGSTPTAASIAYSGPITISSSETLNAIAVAVNYNQSAVASTTYTIKSPITPTITWATPAAISYGTALSGTQLNASSMVAGSFVYLPVAGTVLNVGQQTLTTTFTPTDTTNYTTAAATVALMVNKVAPGIALVSSGNPAFVSNPVTFTATLSTGVGAPTGTISFYDGVTLLGAGPVNTGAVTYMTSALAAGAHSISAAYAGDSNFTAVTSSAVTETIENFSVGVVSGGSTSATASPGGQAVYTFAVTPPPGNTLAGPITFSVIGLPAGATATFSPSSLAAGAGATNVTMTVSVPATAEALPLPRPFSNGALPMALGLILMPFAGLLGKASRRLKMVACPLVLGVAALAFAMGLTACGGSSTSQSKNPPPRTYTLTVAANSGPLSNTFNVTLIVQ